MAPQRKLKDQRILDPNVFVLDFPLDPWTREMWTNNFVQQGLNRILGYSDLENKWVRLRVSAEGRLLVDVPIEAPLKIIHYDRESAVITLFESEKVDAGGVITHAAVDVSAYRIKGVFISTNQDCTVYVQQSPDGTNWFDLKSPADTDRTWNCDNEKIAFYCECPSRYARILIHNTSGSEATVSAYIQGQV